MARTAPPLAPCGLFPEPALLVPLDAPACPVAAHRPPDAPNLSIGKGGIELSVERPRPGQQAFVRAAQRQLAERREQGAVFPLTRRRDVWDTPALRDRPGELVQGVRLTRGASGTSDRSSIRSETSATRRIGGTCTLSARSARRKFGPSFAVRKSCARVVSASLHAVTFDTIWSSEVRAIHSSRARLRLTHLCRADQRSQCVTVATSGPDGRAGARTPRRRDVRVVENPGAAGLGRRWRTATLLCPRSAVNSGSIP